ncbi:Uncharacterised protein [Vibrio cholerae]|nr:Uncharacterised protein [Vibrio cholerae]CSB48654.1 Uncharacterised protein [Vibrio cholerae]
MTKTSASGRTAQNIFRLLVRVLPAPTMKIDRTTNHRILNHCIGVSFCLCFDVGHHGAHQIFKKAQLNVV